MQKSNQVSRAIFILLVLTGASSVSALDIKPFDINSPKREQLTREYARIHYALDSYRMELPRIVVIHYTAIATAAGSLQVFKPDLLPGHRKELTGHGQVNVGVHFLVDRDGTIYSLLPLEMMGRHVIGFNHVSIGIENVGKSAKSLTEKQLQANVKLVKWLKERNDSIVYLIGHHEYMKRNLPHFSLYKELDKTYRPTIKSDPGDQFMHKLRERLSKAGLSLKN